MQGESRNLDVLRSIAVLSVVVSHLPYMTAFASDVFLHNIGVGGVLIFFVHTSLVLLLSLDRTKTSRPAATFYVRRAFRIFPLTWLCIGLVLITGITDVPWETVASLGVRGILINMALVQNVFHAPSIIGPLWSLPWEVQMYVLLPVLYWIIKKHKHFRTGLLLWSLPVLLRWLAPLIDARFAANALIFPSYFLGGVVAYQLRQRVLPGIPAGLWPVMILLVTLARCALLRGDDFQSTHNATVNACTCLSLGLAIPFFKDLQTPFLTVPAKVIAKYSYGIYLFHAPILYFAFQRAGNIPILAMFAIFLVLTTIIPVATYHLLEYPAIKYGRYLSIRWFGVD